MTATNHRQQKLQLSSLTQAMLMTAVLLIGQVLGSLDAVGSGANLYPLLGGAILLLLATWLVNWLSYFAAPSKVLITGGLMLGFIVALHALYPANANMWLVLIPIMLAAASSERRELTIALSAGAVCLGYLWFTTQTAAAASIGQLLLPIFMMLVTAWVVYRLAEQLRMHAVTAANSAGLDALTGFLNMRMFLQEHARVHKQAVEQRRQYALIIADIDGLRSYNDQYGYAQGDRVVVAVADAIRRSLRKGDFVARYSGDEFILCLVNAENDAVQSVMNTVMQNVYNITLSAGHKARRINVHTGMATYPNSGATCDAMISFANQAMYRDKEFRRRTKSSTDSDESRRQAGVTW